MTPHSSATRTAPSFVSYTWSTSPDEASTISVLPPPISATATSRPEISNARATLKNASRASSFAEMTSIESFSSLRTRSQNSGPSSASRSAGADRANLVRAVAGGDREEIAQHVDRRVGRLGIEPAGLRHRRGQPRVLALFIEHAIPARGQHLGHDQPNAVRPDINRRDAAPGVAASDGRRSWFRHEISLRLSAISYSAFGQKLVFWPKADS